MHLSRVCVVLAIVALALVGAGSALATAVAPAAKEKASWAGTWNILDHGTAGRAAGNDYTWSVTLTQSGSTIKSIGTPTPYTVQGTASGKSATFTVVGCCNYTGEFKVTLSDDGQRFTGRWTDSQGNAGTAVGTRSTEPPPDHALSGKVVERTCSPEGCTQTGLEGVTVSASGGPGGPEQATTAADGTYSLTLGEGTWRVEPTAAGRQFEHVDAQGEGDGTGFATVELGADLSGVDFQACATEDAEPGADDPPAALAKTSAKGCKHFKVEIVRIKAAGDSGWTESSGKKLLGNAKIPVGFTQPTRDGDFLWQCRTGCLNVRVRVRDAKTGRAIPGATVSMSVLAAPGTVSADAPNGVACPALPYAKGCGERIERELGGKRDFDAYYWLPGVIERTNARIYVQVRAPGYVPLKKTQNVVVVPNAARKHTLRFRPADASQLVYWGSMYKGLAYTDVGSYCDAILSSLNDLAGGLASAGSLSVLGTLAQDKVKELKKGCGALDFGELVAKLSVITPWKLYLWFVPRFKVPRNGLLGTSNIINRPAQLAIGFAGFFDAFNEGLVAYLYGRFDPTNPVKPDLQGNPLQLEIFEVSHRLASGKVKDALYIRFTGKQQGEPAPPEPYTAYVEGGYYPGCWLNPKLNEAEFSVFDLNPCRTDEP